MSSEWTGASVVVTGASSGIGAALCERLVALGAQVIGLSRSATACDGATPLRCDVGDADSVSAAFAAVDDLIGEDGLSHVACCAGVVSEHAIDELPPAEWRRVVDASLTGTYLTLHHAVPLLRRHGRGSVIAMSSGWVRRGYARGAHYAAAKGGVEALVRSLAIELAPDRIRVNAVAPGPVKTPMLYSKPDFDEAQRASIIPLGRLAETGDVIAPALFLLGDGADHITGQVLQVSGGLTMG